MAKGCVRRGGSRRFFIGRASGRAFSPCCRKTLRSSVHRHDGSRVPVQPHTQTRPFGKSVLRTVQQWQRHTYARKVGLLPSAPCCTLLVGVCGRCGLEVWMGLQGQRDRCNFSAGDTAKQKHARSRTDRSLRSTFHVVHSARPWELGTGTATRQFHVTWSLRHARNPTDEHGNTGVGATVQHLLQCHGATNSTRPTTFLRT